MWGAARVKFSRRLTDSTQRTRRNPFTEVTEEATNVNDDADRILKDCSSFVSHHSMSIHNLDVANVRRQPQFLAIFRRRH